MTTPTSDLFALQTVISHVRRSGDWIVVVAPTSRNRASELGKLLVGLAPPEAEVGGRTVLFPEGGRVTVVGGSQALHGDDFRVLFLGFDGQLLPADEIAMHAWRSAATEVVTLGSHAGELRGTG